MRPEQTQLYSKRKCQDDTGAGLRSKQSRLEKGHHKAEEGDGKTFSATLQNLKQGKVGLP